MPLPVWSSEYSLGNELIDREHEGLFRLLETLERNLYSETDLEMSGVLQAVHTLVSHVEDHFRHEEAYMEGLAAMPKAQRTAHHEDHERWKVRMQEYLPPLLKAATDLERRGLLAKTLLVGKAFWEEHFQHFDRRIGDYVPKS